MELSLSFHRLVPVLAIAMVALTLPGYAQINTPCSPATLSAFTPCMNFLTNSTATSNGTAPTKDCCNSLKNLTSNGMDCFCLITTGSVPFQLPINRTLAISLPRACNMPGVPFQCKASGTPIPAPGPASLGPTLSPRESPTESPQAPPVVPEPTPSATPPESDTTPGLTPPSPDVDSGSGSGSGSGVVPTTTPGSRPVLTPPSAAMPTTTVSTSILLFALGFVLLKYY